METSTPSADVRVLSDRVAAIDVVGDLTPAGEPELMAAWEGATARASTAVLLDFTRLDYMNSGGIGLLVSLLVKSQRSGHGLHAYGLTDHYRQIFELTRLDETIGIHDDEAAALAAVG